MSAAGASSPMLVEPVEALVMLLRYETTAILVVVSGNVLGETLLCDAIVQSGSRVDETKGWVVSAEFSGAQLHDRDRSPIVIW